MPSRTRNPVAVIKADGTIAPSRTTYVDSKRWETRRRLYYQTHPKCCAACRWTGSKANPIHLHHRTYVNIGAELDEDLVPLCRRHHKLVHRVHREHRSAVNTLPRCTDLVIAAEGRIENLPPELRVRR